MKIVVVTGSIGEGKTRRLNQIILESEYPAYGCLSLKKENQGLVAGYDLQFLPSGEAIPFIRDKQLFPELANEGPSVGSWFPYRRFYFAGHVFRQFDDYCKNILSTQSATQWVVDEAGPLEVERKGFFKTINRILQSPETKILYLSIRSSLVDSILSVIELPEGIEVSVMKIS